MKPHQQPPPEIYRRAAKWLKDGNWNGACWAIQTHCFPVWDAGRALLKFADYFRPEDVTYLDYWWGDIYDSKERDCRILALLLMAEIVEDGE